jgi:regulatory protein
LRLGGAAKVEDSEIGRELFERWALAYLGRFASSAENLRRVLLRRVRRRSPPGSEAAPEAAALIDALVERYRRSGLLDDAAYAAQRVQSLNRRGESMAKIRARLVAKGIQNSVATDALSAFREEAGDPDLGAACAFARRRRLGPYRRGEVDQARDLAAFARAGFSRQIARRVLACSDIEAVEALAQPDLG